MKFPLVCLALVLPAPALAALSGFHDRAAQIAAITGSEAVAEALRQLPIEKIEHEETRADGSARWEVEGPDCDLDVILTPTAPQGVGATVWTVASVGRCD